MAFNLRDLINPPSWQTPPINGYGTPGAVDPNAVMNEIVVTPPDPLAYENPQYKINDNSVPDKPVLIPQAAPDTSAFPRTQASPQEVARSQTLEGLPKHKGMFGMKGTLRDVLGLFGDALLTGSGNKPIYGPVRQQERISDAMVGFGQGNDEADRAAIARVMAQNPEAGSQLLQMYQAQRAKQAQLNINQQKVQADTAEAADKKLAKGRELAANIMNMVRQRGDTSILPAAIARAEQITGLTAEQLGLNPQMSLDDVGLYAYSNIKGNQQENIDIARQRLAQQMDIAKMNEAGRMARDNPPSPSREGISNVDAEVARAVMQGNATPEQEAYWNNRLKKQTKKSPLDALRGNSPASKAGRTQGRIVVQGGNRFQQQADGSWKFIGKSN